MHEFFQCKKILLLLIIFFLLQEVIFDIVHHLEDFLHEITHGLSLHDEMIIRHRQEVVEQKRRDEEKRLQSEKEVGPTQTLVYTHTCLYVCVTVL